MEVVFICNHIIITGEMFSLKVTQSSKCPGSVGSVWLESSPIVSLLHTEGSSIGHSTVELFSIP